MCYLWRVYCRARLGVIFPMDHIMLGWQSSVFRASVQYPSTSVCISWHGRKLITIISRLVPSKKQISCIGATSLIGRASSSNCLSVCLSRSVLFLFLRFPMITSPNSSNWTTQGIDPRHCSNRSCALAGVVAVWNRKSETRGHIFQEVGTCSTNTLRLYSLIDVARAA